MVAHAKGERESNSAESPSLYMMPFVEERMDLNPLEGNIPAPVLQHCKSTQEVYYSGNFTATGIMVQSTIETLFSNFLPTGNSEPTLSLMIENALSELELDSPLRTMAAALRPGEHLHQLLGEETTMNRQTADALMGLVEGLIRFLYLAPTELTALDHHLQELNRQSRIEREKKGHKNHAA